MSDLTKNATKDYLADKSSIFCVGISFMSLLPLQPPLIPPKFMVGQPHWVWQLWRPIWLGRRPERLRLHGLHLLIVPEVFVGGRFGPHHRGGQPQLVDGQHRQRQPPQQAETQQRPPLFERLVVLQIVGIETQEAAARPHEAEADRHGGRRAVWQRDLQAASLVLRGTGVEG